MSEYRTLIGSIQFDPRDGTAAGKPVRNVTIQQAGTSDQAKQWSVTLWPSHAHVSVAKGDVIVVTGKASKTAGQDKDGNPREYFNLSANGIINLGAFDTGAENASAPVATTASGPDLF